ncbi:MAG: c-type cytochrome [Mariprofundaceae bacterium]|nr:c-type cytochrome [Mariprofundaceae bacterium]
MTVVNTVILLFAAALVVAIVQSMIKPPVPTIDNSLPYYSTADPALTQAGSDLYHALQCRSCHKIWSVKSLYNTVPAPSLDGMGSLRSEAWLFRYFSSENPQEMLPTRLKPKYKMPSYAFLSEAERRLLARYFSSLRVRDWYLDETIKAEQKKLLGH